MAEPNPAAEGLLTANRIRELYEAPVQGAFDTAHLREVHRRIFQDLPHHAPGSYRPDAPGHVKARQLEASGQRYEVPYLRGRDIPAQLDRVLGELRAGRGLRVLDHATFAWRLAEVYGDLDHIHPFREGNSRTLRVFSSELARSAGQQLDWGGSGADAASRDRLYLARDREVLERHYPGLDEARAMATDNRAEYEAYFVLSGLRRAERLSSLIEASLRPLSAWEQESGLVQTPSPPQMQLNAFAEQAARQLAAASKRPSSIPTRRHWRLV